MPGPDLLTSPAPLNRISCFEISNLPWWCRLATMLSDKKPCWIYRWAEEEKRTLSQFEYVLKVHVLLWGPQCKTVEETPVKAGKIFHIWNHQSKMISPWTLSSIIFQWVFPTGNWQRHLLITRLCHAAWYSMVLMLQRIANGDIWVSLDYKS